MSALKRVKGEGLRVKGQTGQSAIELALALFAIMVFFVGILRAAYGVAGAVISCQREYDRTRTTAATPGADAGNTKLVVVPEISVWK